MNLIERLQDNTQAEALVMGILNITPDSFSDGGQFVAESKWQAQAKAMVEAGVDIIDVGGESTRPGADSVSLEEELERVVPVITWLKQNLSVWVSVDTYKAPVMQAAIEAGVDMINDVNALQGEGALSLVAKSGLPVCLMHRQGVAKTMQDAPYYEDVLLEVSDFLVERANAAIDAGVASSALVLDPGFGFGKTLAHNVRLFESLEELVVLGYPLLVGVSRKKMIGDILAKDGQPLDVAERQVGSVAAALLAQLKGARIVRVHDVAETVQALKVVQTLL